MKKLFIGLFIAFISIISINTIKADSFTSVPYVGSFEYCKIRSSDLVSSTYHYFIWVYDISSLSYGDTLSFTTTFDLSKIPSLVVDSNPLSFDNSCNNDNYSYRTFSYLNVTDSSVVFTKNNNSSSNFLLLYNGSPLDEFICPFSLGCEVSSQPESTIPSVTLPTSDYFLFYDFDTISDFNVFSDFDFTSFTDYEKLMVTIVVNIFYLGFLGFCCYICLKGLYKMLSWVFR